jgi:hypothetical protein
MAPHFRTTLEKHPLAVLSTSLYFIVFARRSAHAWATWAA